MSWKDYPNLQRRPYSPNRGRGRVQVGIRRAFMAAGVSMLSTSLIYDWALRPGRQRRSQRRQVTWGRELGSDCREFEHNGHSPCNYDQKRWDQQHEPDHKEIDCADGDEVVERHIGRPHPIQAA